MYLALLFILIDLDFLFFHVIENHVFKDEKYAEYKRIKKSMKGCSIETTGMICGYEMVQPQKRIMCRRGRSGSGDIGAFSAGVIAMFAMAEVTDDEDFLTDMGGSDEYDTRNAVYSPIITYQDMYGESHKVNALHYKKSKPIEGRRAKVFYKVDEPDKAYVCRKRKHIGVLWVREVDEFEVRCRSLLGRKVRIPKKMVDDELEPGCILVEEYGYYHAVFGFTAKGRKRLQVVSVGEHVVRCRRGWIRNIRVPINLMDQTVVAGDYIVEQFGRYYPEPKEGMELRKEKSLMDKMDEMYPYGGMKGR